MYFVRNLLSSSLGQIKFLGQCTDFSEMLGKKKEEEVIWTSLWFPSFVTNYPWYVPWTPLSSPLTLA